MQCNHLKFLIIFFSASFLSCVSLVEYAGRALDGSAFEERAVAMYRSAGMEIRVVQDRAGEGSVIIMLYQFPTMRLRGSLPDARGEFFLTALDYLGGSPHGWNEYRLDIFGTGQLILGETTARFSIPDAIEPIAVSSGRIRRYDARITGTEALTSLRNRYERILALTEWMTGTASAGGADVPTDMVLDDFERYWKPILFPELVRRRHRPQGWRQFADRQVRAEDIRWNTGYTSRTFPELLRDIRNSGTMLRDWEEALDWVYNEYHRERIALALSQETVLLQF